MKTWPVQDAKARFSEFVDACLHGGPQAVTRRGVETAVLVSARQWHAMQQANVQDLKTLLLSPQGRTSGLVPSRGRLRRRAPTPDA